MPSDAGANVCANNDEQQYLILSQHYQWSNVFDTNDLTVSVSQDEFGDDIYLAIFQAAVSESFPDFWRFYEDPLWLLDNGISNAGSPPTPRLMYTVDTSRPWNFPSGPLTNAMAQAWDFNFDGTQWNNADGFPGDSLQPFWFHQPGDEFYMRVGNQGRLLAGCDSAWLGLADEGACSTGDDSYTANVLRENAPMLKFTLHTADDQWSVTSDFAENFP